MLRFLAYITVKSDARKRRFWSNYSHTTAHPDAADAADWPFVSIRHIRNNSYLFRICPYLNVLYIQVRFHPRPNFEKSQKFGTDETSVIIRKDM